MMPPISTTENRLLMAQAREALTGRWGMAVGATLILMLVPLTSELVPRVGPLISILVGGPLSVGFAMVTLALSRKQDAAITQLFDGFQRFGVAIGAYILTTIFTVLWLLLLIIPGIMAALSYSMTYFIIAEDDSIGPLQAITKSKNMMRGNKWKLFCLGCRFTGWAILCILTLGIGFLWFIPYAMVSLAGFYEEIKGVHETETAVPAVAGEQEGVPGSA